MDLGLQLRRIQRLAPTPLGEILVPIFGIFPRVELLDLLQQLGYLALHLLLVALRVLRPYKAVLTGVRFQLGPVHKVVLQLDIPAFDQDPQHGGKDLPDRLSHHYSAEPVDRAKVRLAVPAQPHEVNILPQRFGDLPRGVDLLAIGVDQYLQQHFRVITGGPTPFVLRVHHLQIHFLDGRIHHPNQVVWLDFFF